MQRIIQFLSFIWRTVYKMIRHVRYEQNEVTSPNYFINAHIFIQKIFQKIKFLVYFGPTDDDFLHPSRHISTQSDANFKNRHQDPSLEVGLFHRASFRHL